MLRASPAAETTGWRSHVVQQVDKGSHARRMQRLRKMALVMAEACEEELNRLINH